MPFVGNLYDFSTAGNMGSKKYLAVAFSSLVTYEMIVSVGISRAKYLIKLNNRSFDGTLRCKKKKPISRKTAT